MPFVKNSPIERNLGIRKVWLHPESIYNNLDANKYKYDYAVAINKGN